MLKDDLLLRLKHRHAGARNAAASGELSAALNTNDRAVRDAVNALRQDGCPICSGDGGYYYAVTPDELRATIAQLMSRIRFISLAVKGLRRALTDMESQDQTRFPID